MEIPPMFPGPGLDDSVGGEGKAENASGQSCVGPLDLGSGAGAFLEGSWRCAGVEIAFSQRSTASLSAAPALVTA